MATIDELFYPKKGKGGYIEDFEAGPTPLISATTENNGVTGFVKATPSFKAPAITVERVAGYAFVQTVDFSTVPDDITVLIPKQKIELEKLFFIASIITNSRWRFSFGRKLTPTRLKAIQLPIEQFSKIRLTDIHNILPERKNNSATPSISRFKFHSLKSIFDLNSGDYHNASELHPGKTPLVSCGNINNGIVGFVEVPKNKTYSQCLTIAYNGSWPLLTKYHPYTFAAKDDVAVCLPKKTIMLSTLIFIQYMLNRETWRYSYGRKCFNEKLKDFKIQLPSTEKGEIDELAIREIMSVCSYWDELNSMVERIRKGIRPNPTIETYLPAK